MALEFTKLVKGSSPVSQVGNYGFFKLAVESSGGGGGSSDVTFSRTFSENTPAQISAVSALISANNMTSTQVAETYGWNIGDKISYKLSTNENVEMRIIGFNHDDKSDGTGKAGITLDMTHCLAKKYVMNNSKTNTGGYAVSVIKTSTIPKIKATLPQEWQDIIKLVNKKSANGGVYYTETLTLSEDLFLLSQIEVFGTKANTAQDNINEGTQYEYWNGKADADRIKKYDTNADGVVDTAFNWWLRSSYYDNAIAFCNCRYIGSSGNSNANTQNCVSFAFCV